MDYLLTWYDGEEVNYRFLQERDLQRIRFEEDKPYSLMEIKSGRVIPNASNFIKHNNM